MKRLFLAMAAMAALLTSCSKDETTTAPVIERSTVTFTVNAPELATRADEGEGLSATKLEYVIYDLAESPENGANQISGETTFPDGSRTTTVEVNLVEGREYEAIFFASAPNSPYTFDHTAQTMTIEDPTVLMANQEAYDAFFKYVEPFEITEKQFSVDVKMKRPFAQLNVATIDYQNDEYPAGAMIDAATTGVKVKAYKTLNLKTGAVDDKTDFVFNLSNKMDGTITAGGEDYSWLSMNYLLVNARETVDVEFSFTDVKGDNTTETYTREYTAVPVERNYRTNIVGSILTSTTTFNVEILPGFERPNIEYDDDETSDVVVANIDDLQDAIDSAKEGTTVIKLDKNIDGTTRAANADAATITITQKEGVNLVIDGCGYEFNGTFYIKGDSRFEGAETLTFRNIDFNHAQGKIDFINSDSTGSTERYAHNVTVENCTFTGNANGTVVGIRFRQAYNVNIVNCVSGEGMFSLAQMTSSSNGLTFDNVTIDDNEEGINLLTSAEQVTIKNSNISAKVYGVRADGYNDGNHLTIENTSIDATYPVVIRSLTNGFDVVFNGQNTLEAGQQYDVIFTNGAYNTLVAPTGEWTISGADDFYVFPREEVISTVEQLAAFRNAVNNGADYKGKFVKLANDIDLSSVDNWTPIGGSDSYNNNFNGTFDGMGYTISNLKVNNNSHAGLFGTMCGATIKNLTVDGAELTSNHYAGGILAWGESGGSRIHIENCHVKNSEITLSAEQGSNGYDNGDKAGGIVGFAHHNYIIGCSVENTTITAYRDCGGIVGYANGGIIKNNNVKEGVKLIQKNDHNYKNYTSVADFNFGDIVGRKGSNAPEMISNFGTVTMEGGIFDGYVVVDGEYYILNAKGLNALNTLMVKKEAGKNVKVNLLDDIDFTGYTWTPVDSHADSAFTFQSLNGNGHTISNLTINGQAMFTRFAGFGDVEIKDVTFDNAKVESTTLNTSILTVQSYQNVTLDNVDVKNSSITGAYKVAPLIATVYNESSSTITATLKNCDVENVTVKATSYDFCTAGMVAFVYASDNDNIVFENCTVKDVKLMAKPNGYTAHAAIYTTGGSSDNLFNEAEGVTVSNVTFEEL